MAARIHTRLIVMEFSPTREVDSRTLSTDPGRHRPASAMAGSGNPERGSSGAIHHRLTREGTECVTPTTSPSGRAPAAARRPLYGASRMVEFVTTEAAPRTLVRPAEVMAGQLDRLLGLPLPNVTLGIIPMGVELALAPAANVHDARRRGRNLRR